MTRIETISKVVTAGAANGRSRTTLYDNAAYGYLEKIGINGNFGANGSLFIIHSGAQCPVDETIFTKLSLGGGDSDWYYPRRIMDSDAGAAIAQTSGNNIYAKIPIHGYLDCTISGVGNSKSGTIVIVYSTP